MNFEFATAARIIFGPGTAAQIPALAAKMGHRVLLVTGNTLERAGFLLDGLTAADMTVTTFQVPNEPTTDLVQAGTEQARENQCDIVVGIGGGSVLDAGKAIAALLTNPGPPLDYLEVIGRGQPLTAAPAPYIAIPTTAGTGAEVTRNAVLASPEHRVKVSLRSPLMLPDLAVVDPELTYSVPPAITASTGLDALTQVMEPYVSNKANPLTDSLCREGMQRAANSLRRAYEDGHDVEARQDMALVSLFGGLALANAKLGAVHGFAGPLGGMFPAPHGVICARLLPPVMAINVRALQERAPDHPALARYDEIARIVTGQPDAQAADGVVWVRDLYQALNVPPLSEYGLSQADFPAVVAKSQRASSMQGNPIPLTDAELSEALEQAL